MPVFPESLKAALFLPDLRRDKKLRPFKTTATQDTPAGAGRLAR
jgi:hypothetical protein